jgi:hypothetical protein
MPAFPLLRGALLALSFIPAAVLAAPDAPDWAASARQDIRFAIDTISARHAGVVAGLPSVTGPLAEGGKLALAEVDGVRSEQDYLRLMRRFIAGFGDPHTGIDLRQQTRGWTGIVLDLVDGRYRVVWTEPGWPNPLPPVVKRTRGPRLAAVIDRNCFSSCMNFVQQLQATGDAVLLGEATIGYSPFGEITRTALPSGRGALYIPSALYVTAQATREPFLPDYPYAGRMSEDDGLLAWVGRTLDGVKAR